MSKEGKKVKMSKNKKSKKSSKMPIFIIIILVIIIVICGYIYKNNAQENPEKVLEEYISKINEAKYEEMYDMIDKESQQKISKQDFINRNKNIYQGIDMTNMKIEITEIKKEGVKRTITYRTNMEISGSQVSFDNTATISKNEEKQYKISWNSNLIFPDLNEESKVRVSKTEAIRGTITDRNGIELAKNGGASSVGIVPGKLSENKEQDIEKIAKLLNTTSNNINSKLQASWVKEDSFVPIKTISEKETELKEKLLQIRGIKITTSESRTYPLGEKAAHITGYVQKITAEELEKNTGYTSSSIIGKTGLEKQFEKRLKGENGIEVYIVDENENKKRTIVKQEKKDGENIKLTIDANIQSNLYNELKNDKGLFVVMNPETGEILALVSTPSYDVNKMTLGITTAEWEEISNNKASPMVARYLQSYCPGSTFKPITGAIGLDSKTLTAEKTFNYSGLSWQKDASWGTHNVTTLTAYNGAKNLKNALIYSDNIYFAQAALQIGKENITKGLNKILFNKNIDFDLTLSKSQYSNNDKINSEGMLADTGYGQGELLVNPIHMASIYSAFYNNGNMIKPYLEYKEDAQKQYLVENAFSEEAVKEIKDDLIQVVENPEGTAHDMKINGITIAGKTGTAELKATREEKADTLGWFNCFTVDYDSPYVVIGMVEEGNKNGGSHYLIPMIKKMFIK